MSALPCLTNTRPNAPIFSVTGGGGGIPANQDITCSTITVGETAVISSISGGGNPVNIQAKATEGGIVMRGDDGLEITTLDIGSIINVSSINAADVVCSTLNASTIVNNDGLLNIGASIINIYAGLGVDILDAGGAGGTLNVSSINVSSINGADVGGGSGLISSIGALDGFASGTSTVQVINTAAAPGPPVKMTPDMTLAPNRSYTFTAQADWSIAPTAGNGEFLYWTVDGANTGFDIMRDFNSFGAGFTQTVPWANSFTLNTGPSTVNARLVVQLQPNLSVTPISSIISPPAAGYRWTLQDNGPIA
jgi:hypothetical protein